MKLELKRCLALSLGAAAILAGGNALAADKELLDILVKNGAIDQKQYDNLLKKATLTAKDAGEVGNAHVKLGDKGLEIASDDGNFKMNVGGRLQVDSQINWNHTDDLGDNTGANSTTNELSTASNIRRARLHAEGTFFKDYDYKFEYDFSRGNGTVAAGITDAYVAWTAVKPFKLTIGQFKEPFSLEEATSNRFISFIERSMAVNTFSDNPNSYMVGLGGAYNTDTWTLQGAIQTEPVGAGNANNTSLNANGNNNRNNGSGNTGWGVTGRATWLPWFNSPTEFLHVGMSGSYRMPNNNFDAEGDFSNGGMRFTSALNTNVDRTSVLDTGQLTAGKKGAATSFEVDHFVRMGAESALVYGPFSLQGEYLRTTVSGRGYDDETLEGFYGYGSYFLTGESRAYKSKTGAWDRLKPNRNFDMAGGWGAWELLAGYDYLNLNDRAINGGQAQTAKVGVNWYPNSHVRLMANFIHVLNVETSLTADNVNDPSSRQQAFNDANPDVLEFRAQVDW